MPTGGGTGGASGGGKSARVFKGSARGLSDKRPTPQTTAESVAQRNELIQGMADANVAKGGKAAGFPTSFKGIGGYTIVGRGRQ